MDADDLWTPEKLRTQLEFMERNAGVPWCLQIRRSSTTTACSAVLCLRKPVLSPRSPPARPSKERFRSFLRELHPDQHGHGQTACFDTTGLFDSRSKVPRIATCGPESRPIFRSRVFPHAGPQEGGRVQRFARRRDDAAISRPLVEQGPASFSGLAPVRTVNALLAPTYVQLGFLLLDRDNTREAREVALQALKIARQPSKWLMATSLFLFSFTGRAFANSAFRAKRWLFANR